MAAPVIDMPFKATHRLRHRESGTPADDLMRVETPHGERFYSESGWYEGGRGLVREDLPSFDFEPLEGWS